jgi:hypothetical protein
MNKEIPTMLSFKVKAYLMTWNWVRALRLFIGIAVLVQGIQMGDWLISSMGGLFGLLALLNAGCGGGQCRV